MNDNQLIKEKKDPCGLYQYQELFDYLADELNAIALNSQLFDIIEIVRRIDKAEKDNDN